jgi:hypothetical protein
MQPDRTASDYLDLSKRHPADTIAQPSWAKAPDGRYTTIAGDDRFSQIFAEWLADACRHERTGVVRWVNAGNQTCYNWYCGDCGTKLSSNIPHDLARSHGCVRVTLDELASRHQAYEAQRAERLEQKKAAAAERAQPENREVYGDYLRSPAWREKARLIMERAAGRCEGCLAAPAEHIHHLTYAHVGNEFAFELVALCAACHRRAHDGGQA